MVNAVLSLKRLSELGIGEAIITRQYHYPGQAPRDSRHHGGSSSNQTMYTEYASPCAEWMPPVDGR